MLGRIEIVPVCPIGYRDPADVPLDDKLVQVTVNGRLTDRRMFSRYRCVHGIRSGMVVHPQDGLQNDLALYSIACLHSIILS